MMNAAVQPLQELLIKISEHLDRIETLMGLQPNDKDATTITTPMLNQLSPLLVAYDERITPLLQPFLGISKKLGIDMRCSRS